MASPNEVFMAQAEKVISSTPDHPLTALINPDTGQFWSRSPYNESYKDHPGVQAGHITSKWAGGDSLALQDAHSNQSEGRFVETAKGGMEHGGIVERTAIDIGGVPVDRDTASMLEKDSLIPKGTVEHSSPSSGWRSGDHLTTPAGPGPEHETRTPHALAPGGVGGHDVATAAGTTDGIAGVIEGVGVVGMGLGAFGAVGLGVGYVVNELGKLSPPHTQEKTPHDDRRQLPPTEHQGGDKPPDRGGDKPPPDRGGDPPPDRGGQKPPPPGPEHGGAVGRGGGMSKSSADGTGGTSAPGSDGTDSGGTSNPGNGGGSAGGSGGTSKSSEDGTGGTCAPGSEGSVATAAADDVAAANHATGSTLSDFASSSVDAGTWTSALPPEDNAGSSPSASVDADLSSSSSALAGSVIDEHALGGATASGSVAADFAFNSVSNDDDLGVSQSDTLADENQVLSSDGSMYGEIYGPMDEGSGIHDSAFDDAIASGSEFASADFDSDVASHDDVAASDTGSDYHHDDTFDDMADDV